MYDNRDTAPLSDVPSSQASAENQEDLSSSALPQKSQTIFVTQRPESPLSSTDQTSTSSPGPNSSPENTYGSSQDENYHSRSFLCVASEPESEAEEITSAPIVNGVTMFKKGGSRERSKSEPVQTFSPSPSPCSVLQGINKNKVDVVLNAVLEMRILLLFYSFSSAVKLAIEPDRGESRKPSVSHTFHWIPAFAGMWMTMVLGMTEGAEMTEWVTRVVGMTIFIGIAIVVRMTVVAWMMNLEIWL